MAARKTGSHLAEGDNQEVILKIGINLASDPKSGLPVRLRNG